MDALTKPLEQTAEGTEFFLRTPSLRLLYIQTSGLLRIPVLQHVTATERLDFNTSPFFVFEAPTESTDDGWLLRTEELRLDWQGLRDSAPAGLSLAPLWPEERQRPPLECFAFELAKALTHLPPTMTGLIIVLAPVWLQDGARFCADLKQLLGLRDLSKARFIVVESDTERALPAIEERANAAIRVDARIDDATVRREMNDQLDAMKRAPAGASGFQLMGAAGPPVPPPVRKGAPPPLLPDQRARLAQSVGVPPALLNQEVMSTLRVLILSAAAAMRDGNSLEAIHLQREARDHCAKNDLVREAVVNDLLLGGYVLQAGHAEKACAAFREGRQRAEGANLMDLAVQAQMAIGSCLVVGQHFDEAALAYAEAGKLGAAHGVPVLATESFRMSGQLHASRGRLDAATRAFHSALAIAETGGDEVKRNSSAKEAARELATLCRKHGLLEQARSLEAQAAAMERLTAPLAPLEADRG